MSTVESGSVASSNRLAFYPALDGLRGFILLVIFLFHLDYHWARGGFLAVSTFYTLSGFLITGLLVTELERTGRIELMAFWGRRFRRLMPAALAGLVLVVVFGITAADPVQLDRLRGDGISALFYSANWWFIYTGADYADLMGSPSPSQHFWSLSIEEQYYLVYPLLTALLFGALLRSRRNFALALGVLAVCSSAWMAYLAGTDVPSTRMYYGTDTRCAELLAGGVLGLAIAGRPLPSGPGAQRAIAALGLLGFAIHLWLWGTASVDSDALYRGGLVLYIFGSLAVIAAALLSGGPIRLLLQARWLQYVGRISYGAYIYHWPLFLWLTPDRLGFDGIAVASLRVGVTLALAALSYRYLEEPIRRGRRLLEWRAWAIPPLATAIVALSFVMITGGFASDSTISEGSSDRAEDSSRPHGTQLRVLVVGDSVAGEFAKGLQAWSRQTGGAIVSNASNAGCGISRYHRVGKYGRRFRGCDNWEARFAAPVERFEPDVVLVYTSGWDMNERQLPGWDAPQHVGHPDFDAWLRSEYSAALDIFSSRGARVFWVSPLCVENLNHGSKKGVFDPTRLRDLRANVLDRLAEENSDRLEVLDLFPEICPAGGVSQTVAGIQNFRPDGIHFSREARRWLGYWLGGRITTAPAKEHPPSVVLVTLDTTRVDHLSCYGYQRVTTPRLDAFAARAVRFRHAWSTSSWTLPAHASLFSGLYPSRHGAHYDQTGEAVLGDVVNLPVARHVKAGKLADEVTTLAEWLAGRGYRTGAFVAGPWLHRGFGLLQGFDKKDDRPAGFGGRPADEITNHALEWLRELPPDQPYLLFANYFDAHAPYDPTETYPDLPRAEEPFAPPYDALMRGEATLDADQRAVLRDRYDAEIRFMDRELGRLLDEVLVRPDGDRTIVIITADHGESLGEEGRFGHGFWLTEELIRVPMIVRRPFDRDAGSWSEDPIQLVDVLPLLAAELGIASPEGIEGVPVGNRSVAFAELYQEATTAIRFGEQYAGNLQTAIRWPNKLLRSDSGDESLLVLSPEDLTERPAGDVASDESLATQLDQHSANRPARALVAPEVDPQTLEALRELGYVE